MSNVGHKTRAGEPLARTALSLMPRPGMTISSGERLAIAGALVIVLLTAFPSVAPLLELRPALLAQQPWRALTGHLVHINWPHALINASAWFVVARLFAPELSGREQALALATSALAIAFSTALWLPQLLWYRGASGALHGLFFAGSARWLARDISQPAQRGWRNWRALWLPLALFAGGWIKVLAEQPGDASTPYANWLGAGVVPQAHLVGAITGTLLGTALWWRERVRQVQ